MHTSSTLLAGALACALSGVQSPLMAAEPPVPDLPILTVPALASGLPAWQLGATAGQATGGRLSLIHVQANQFHVHRSGKEASLLDTETGLTRLDVFWQPRSWLGTGLQVGHLRHSGGVLDRAIENWHEVFGMPQAGRTDQPRRRTRLIYRDEHGVHLNQSSPVQGPADASLWLDFSTPDGYSLQMHLRMPVSPRRTLIGTDGWSASLGTGHAASLTVGQQTIGLAALAGLTWYPPGKQSPWQHRRKRMRGSFAASIHALTNPRWGVFARLDVAGPAYDSEIEELGRSPVQLQLGIRHRLQDKVWLSLALAEDLNRTVSPDFALQARIDYQWMQD